MTLGRTLRPFGTLRVLSQASETLTAAEVNKGLTVSCGLAGTQSIALPVASLVGNPSVFFCANDSNVSAINVVTITGITPSQTLTTVNQCVTLYWNGAGWVKP
jgi:hypothetical protein